MTSVHPQPPAPAKNLQYCAICRRVIQPNLAPENGSLIHEGRLVHAACLRPAAPKVKRAGSSARGAALAAPDAPAARSAKKSTAAITAAPANAAGGPAKSGQRKTTAAITAAVEPVTAPTRAPANRPAADGPSRGLLIGIGVGALLALVVGAYLVLSGPASTTPPAATSSATAAGDRPAAAKTPATPAAQPVAKPATPAPAPAAGDGFSPAGPVEFWFTDDSIGDWKQVRGNPQKIGIQLGELKILAADEPFLFEHAISSANYDLTFEARLDGGDRHEAVAMELWSNAHEVVNIDLVSFESFGWTPVTVKVRDSQTTVQHGFAGHAELHPAKVSTQSVLADRATLQADRPVVMLYASAAGAKYVRNIQFTPMQPTPVTPTAVPAATAAVPATGETPAAPAAASRPEPAGDFNHPASGTTAAAPAPQPGDDPLAPATASPAERPAAPQTAAAGKLAPQANPAPAPKANPAPAPAPAGPAPAAKGDGTVLLRLEGRDMKNGYGVWKRMVGVNEEGQTHLQWTCEKTNSFPFFRLIDLKQLPQQVNVHLRYRVKNFTDHAIAIRVYFTNPETQQTQQAEAVIPVNGENVWLEGDAVMHNVNGPINQVEVRPANAAKEGMVIEVGQVLISDGPVKATTPAGQVQGAQQAQQTQQAGAAAKPAAAVAPQPAPAQPVAPAANPPAAPPAQPAANPAAPQPAKAATSTSGTVGAAPGAPAPDSAPTGPSRKQRTPKNQVPQEPGGGLGQSAQIEQAPQTQQATGEAKRK